MLRPGLLAGGILCVALNLILRCKFSQNLPTNDSLKKVPVKLQVPENCILPGFFKILPPRRHSLGQRVRKGCGILSFSPSLYMYTHTYYIHGDRDICKRAFCIFQYYSVSFPMIHSRSDMHITSQKRRKTPPGHDFRSACGFGTIGGLNLPGPRLMGLPLDPYAGSP